MCLDRNPQPRVEVSPSVPADPSHKSAGHAIGPTETVVSSPANSLRNFRDLILENLLGSSTEGVP
ncbi:MAG: hypothetical protein ACP5I8_14310 [Phycisphaerae bacterium]